MTDIGRKWSPFVIGSRFYIKPGNGNIDKKGMINIRLGAGRAFGSGEHETTKHCLEIMESLSFSPHQKVLDYGTGTGILAIAAAKLGANFTLALDLDENAALACKSNLRLNNLDGKVFVACGDLTSINPHYQFHIILANIYSDIIIERALLISKLLKKNGYLLLSGIDWDYFDDVKRCFAGSNYQIVKVQIGTDYNTMLYQKITD